MTTATQTKPNKVDKKDKEPAPEEQRLFPPHKLAPKLVKQDDIMAFVYYAKVRDVQMQGESLSLQSIDDNQEIGGFTVTGAALVGSSLSADRYTSEEKVSKSKAAELLINADFRPFTVCFEKQNGEERVLRGRLVAAEPLLGRSHVVDLDITTGHNLRLVDHRTVRWLIINTVRYTVK